MTDFERLTKLYEDFKIAYKVTDYVEEYERLKKKRQAYKHYEYAYKAKIKVVDVEEGEYTVSYTFHDGVFHSQDIEGGGCSCCW